MEYVKMSPCRYNTFISCNKNNCFSCGWNPDVNKDRRNKIHVVASRGKLREEWGKKHERVG